MSYRCDSVVPLYRCDTVVIPLYRCLMWCDVFLNINMQLVCATIAYILLIKISDDDRNCDFLYVYKVAMMFIAENPKVIISRKKMIALARRIQHDIDFCVIIALWWVTELRTSSLCLTANANMWNRFTRFLYFLYLK